MVFWGQGCPNTAVNFLDESSFCSSCWPLAVSRISWIASTFACSKRPSRCGIQEFTLRLRMVNTFWSATTVVCFGLTCSGDGAVGEIITDALGSCLWLISGWILLASGGKFRRTTASKWSRPLWAIVGQNDRQIFVLRILEKKQTQHIETGHKKLRRRVHHHRSPKCPCWTNRSGGHAHRRIEN